MNGTFVNGFKLGKGKQHSIPRSRRNDLSFTDGFRGIHVHWRGQVEAIVSTLCHEEVSDRKSTKRGVECSCWRGLQEKHPPSLSLLKRRDGQRITIMSDDNFKEADIPLNIVHSCVTRVLEVFYEQMIFAIVMEYAPGVNFLMKL